MKLVLLFLGIAIGGGWLYEVGHSAGLAEATRQVQVLHDQLVMYESTLPKGTGLTCRFKR